MSSGPDQTIVASGDCLLFPRERGFRQQQLHPSAPLCCSSGSGLLQSWLCRTAVMA